MTIIFETADNIEKNVQLTLVPAPSFCVRRLIHELIDKTLVVTEAHGKIGNLSVSAANTGQAAGVEATFHFAAGISVEILGWYEYGRLVTGLTLYDGYKTPPTQVNETVKLSNPGEMLLYDVMGHPGAIHTVIKRPDGTTIFDNIYICTPDKIITFQTELEYYRMPPDSFSFRGTVTLDWGYDPSVGRIPLGPACTFIEGSHSRPPDAICREFLSFDHYQAGDSWIMNGIIRDP